MYRSRGAVRSHAAVFAYVYAILRVARIARAANRANPSRAHLARTSSSYRYIASVRVVRA